MSNTIWIILSFLLYVGAMLAIGFVFASKSQNLNDYFLGGRNLNSWVAAMSAQASDMSGWLLMGLPGAVYALGTGQVWIAVGLAIGTILNWVFVAKRLRRYTIVANDSITLPQYFENRFKDSSNILKLASAVFIAIFFAVYTASAFVAGGTLFSQVFNIDYTLALVISVTLILVYTFLGGFAAVCWTDLVQGILMLVAILAVPIIAYFAVGGSSVIADSVKDMPGFLDPMSDGGEKISLISIISQLAWGLGYFGMPHILVRFMAIKDEKSVKKSRLIAIVWVILSLCFAIGVGVIGAAYLPGLEDKETVFIQMIQKVFLSDQAALRIPLVGGLFLCGILAAIMSTADSQLLVTASSLTGDIYNTFDKKASDKKLVWISRSCVVIVSVIAFLMALDRTSSIMDLVSNAWSGFGSAFGALVLLSLYWKRINRTGAAAGIISGGLTVIVWDYVKMINLDGSLVSLGTKTGIYSLVPGFLISFICIIIFSLATKEPNLEIYEEFEKIKTPVE